MKKQILVLTALLLIGKAGIGQTLTDLYNQHKNIREAHENDNDERKVKLGLFVDYNLSNSAKIRNNEAFYASFGGGLKLYIPVIASGDGTNIGDITGDITLSAAYTNWTGGLDENINSLPDMNCYSGMLGFRVGIADMVYFEPQVGYDYGNYSNYKLKDTSGLMYGLRAGLSLFHGFVVDGLVQITNTKLFGNPISYGAGIEVHF